MAKIQFDLPLFDTEAGEEESLSGVEVGFKETRLRSGVGIEDKTYQRILTSYPDYKDNSDDYQQFAGLMDNNRARYTHALNNKTFALDEDDNIIDGENGFVGSSLLYDMEAMRGYMLAENNGFNSVGFDSVYATITEEESKSLAKEKEGTSLIGQVAGSLGAYAYDPLTLIDIASPGKIMGSTVLKGAAKAFGVEAAFAATSEIARQEEIKKHMARAGLEYTLWDSTKEIIMNAGFGGLVRGIGSAVVDYKTFSKINSGITNATDKEIFQRFAKRENFKLTQNTTKHIQIMEKVEDDINNGKDVDVSALTDIDINTKVDPNIQPVSIIEELSNDYKAKGYDIEEKALDDNIKAKPIVDDIYDGMATNDDGDALIKEFYSDAEIQAELKQIEEMEMTLSRDEELALAEDTKPNLQGFQAQEMTVGTETINKTDFDLIQKRMKTREFNRDNPDNQRIVPQSQEDAYNRNVNIADDLKDLDFEAGGSGAVFSKFADNLAAGTVAGVEEDEQGNITFNPEKFVAGLGGYTAAKAMFKAGAFDGLPDAVNSQVKKYFGVDLDSSIVESAKTIKALSAENKTTIPKVPVGNIFKNDYKTLPSNKIKEIDKIINSDTVADLPLDNIEINLIVPTQRNITIPNLEKVKKLDIKPDEEIILVENDGLFYLVDGHHRVSMSILDGLDNIEARVLNDSNIVPTDKKVLSEVVDKKNTNINDIKNLDIVSKFQKDVKAQILKHGDIENIDYSMMDISDRELTRVQRVKNTIEEIEDDPENAIYTASTYSEFQEIYFEQFKYANIKPVTKNGKVKIYRSATGDIEPGDWIGLDKGYAKSHSRTDNHKTYEMWADYEDIRWQGADANEWIYLPDEIVKAEIDYKVEKEIK
tara:strand:+ start:1627 stop:4254 length:2628 start_codon:yes stop_codon:yes gene_type:complete